MLKKSIDSANIVEINVNAVLTMSGIQKKVLATRSGYAEPHIMDLFQYIRPSLYLIPYVAAGVLMYTR